MAPQPRSRPGGRWNRRATDSVLAIVVAIGLGICGAVAVAAFVLLRNQPAGGAPAYCPFQTGSGMETPAPGDTRNTSPNATVYQNGSVIFTASASGCVPPYTFTWVFGDGQSSDQPNVVHVYPGPGYYPGSLTIQDSAGHQATSFFCVDAHAWPSLTGGSGSSPPACPT